MNNVWLGFVVLLQKSNESMGTVSNGDSYVVSDRWRSPREKISMAFSAFWAKNIGLASVLVLWGNS
jgi:hypothetical protein